MHDNSMHDLTDELVKLAGRGAAKRERLAKLPVLCELARAQGDPWHKGQMALEYLVFEIGCVEQPISFLGQERSAQTMQMVWILCLDLNCTKRSSPERKELALQLLGLYQSWEWWRKGPEREALYLLASHIVSSVMV